MEARGAAWGIYVIEVVCKLMEAGLQEQKRGTKSDVVYKNLA